MLVGRRRLRRRRSLLAAVSLGMMSFVLTLCAWTMAVTGAATSTKNGGKEQHSNGDMSSFFLSTAALAQ